MFMMRLVFFFFKFKLFYFILFFKKEISGEFSHSGNLEEVKDEHYVIKSPFLRGKKGKQ